MTGSDWITHRWSPEFDRATEFEVASVEVGSVEAPDATTRADIHDAERAAIDALQRQLADAPCAS